MDAFALALRMETTGFEQATRKLTAIESVGSKTASSLDHVSKKAAGIGQAIATAGELGVSSMEKIVRATTDVAFAFGPQGALVAAAGAATLAIVGIFSRARKEMDDTTLKFKTNLGQLIDTGNREGLMAAAGTLFRGTPSKGFADAVRPKLEELAQIRENIETATRQRNAFWLLALKKRREELESDPAVVAYQNLIRQIMNPTLPFTPQGLQTVTIEGDRHRKTLDIHRPKSAAEMIGITPTDETAAYRAYKAYGQPMPLVSAGPTRELDAYNRAQKELADRMAQMAEEMRANITSVFGDAIVEGFQAAFSGRGIGGVFKALGKSILSGLGSIFMQMGQKMVAASALMQAFQNAIMNFFPGAGLVAGIALMALGGAMMSAGGAIGAGGGGGAGVGAAGNGYYSQREDITKIRLMPGFGSGSGGSEVNPRGAINNHFTVIGPNDPRAQRQITDLIDKAARRGM